MGQVGRPPRRRWPVVLLVLIAVVVGALVAADFLAKDATQNAIAKDVQRSTRSDGAGVTITSFPFLYDAAAEGRVDRVEVTDRGVPVGLLRLDSVTLVGSQVRFDRNLLLEHHTIHLTSVGSATISVSVHLSSIVGTVATSLGVEVLPEGPGQIAISAAGRTVATIDLTRIPIIPACALQVGHSGDVYTFSCRVSPVPQSVLAALSKAQTGAG